MHYPEFAKGENPLIAYLKHFCNTRKQGLLIAITGGRHMKTGEGKTFTALALLEELDPTFFIDKIAMDATQFITIANHIEDIGTPCQGMMADEAEVMASNRSYYSIYNKALVDVGSTMRNLRCVAVLCLPKLDMVDKKLQHLVSHWGYVEKHVEDGGQLKVRFYFYRLITNPLGKGEPKPQKIIMWSQELRRKVSFDYFEVKLPSKKLMNAYLDLEKDYKRNLRDGLLEEIAIYEKSQGKSKAVNLQVVKTKILSSEEELAKIRSKRGIIDRNALQHYHNLGQKEASILKRELEEMFEQKKKPMVIK